jgi:uncharacterized lipoprotein YmbA
LPIIELSRVSLPDYLDSTDMLRRDGARVLVPSSTGRWAERLSFVISDAMIPTLSRLAPQAVVSAGTESRPSRRLTLQIDRFDLAADGSCRISARWRWASADGKTTLSSASSSLERRAASPGDAEMAAAMTILLDQLADQMIASMPPF